MMDWQIVSIAAPSFIGGIIAAAGIARWHERREDSENVLAAYRWGDQWKARYDAIFGPRVSRVECIDEYGREYVAYGVRVRDYALQDEGQTLKVFLETRPHLPLYPRIGEYQTVELVDLEPTGGIYVEPWGSGKLTTDEQRALLDGLTEAGALTNPDTKD